MGRGRFSRRDNQKDWRVGRGWLGGDGGGWGKIEGQGSVIRRTGG